MKTCTHCGDSKDLGEYYKSKSAKDGLRSWCKECSTTDASAWAKTNKDKRTAINRKCANSQGYSVYMAIFPSGLYIGSGLTRSRRNCHSTGKSTIAKSLKEKATSFEVLMKGSKEKCIQEESKLIDLIGLDKLLNTKR